MLTQFLASLVMYAPGLVTGWLVGTASGWAMKRDDYTRHAPPPQLALPPVQAESQRLPPVARAVINVHIGSELLRGIGAARDYNPAPRVIDAQIVPELPE